MPIRSTLQTIPPEFEIGVAESLQLNVDFTPLLGDTETILSQTCEVEREDGTTILDPSVFLPEAANRDGNIVSCRFENAEESRVYRLRYSVTTNLENVWSSFIRVIGINT